jgi:hypothetical protein
MNDVKVSEAQAPLRGAADVGEHADGADDIPHVTDKEDL